ncbi:MAG: hypothetical protein AB1304_01705 [Bacteroidota bacterium]
MNQTSETVYLYSVLKSLHYFRNILSERPYSPFSDFLQSISLSKNLSDVLDRIDQMNATSFVQISNYAAGILSKEPSLKQKQNLRLQNIFSSLKPSIATSYFSHKTLTIDLLRESDTKLDTLWEQFMQQLQTLSQNTSDQPIILAENILSLIQYYFSFTSTYLQGQNNLSLYNHTKITAGLFTSYTISENQSVLIVGGDVSGIQNFIYDIVNKQASKNLKGRSFYLQLIVDAIVHYILQNTYPFRANIIYSSGGSFFLFLPDTTDIKEKLSTQIIPYIQRQIYHYHKTQFSIPVTYTSFSPLSSDTNTSSHWRSLMDELSKLKRAPFRQLLSEKYEEFFKKTENGGYVVLDDFSGETLDTKKAFVLKENNDIAPYNPNRDYSDDVLIISEYNKDILLLAKNLREAKYIIKYNHPTKETLSICNLLHIKLANHIHENDLDDATEILIINPSFQKVQPFIFHPSVVNTIYFYGGNDYPRNEQNNIITDFSELAEDQQSGLKRLGILRMDVDNLGSVFSSGLPSFSHYSTLSYFLDMFFKYYLNHLWGSNPQYRNSTTIIYSGGDDLFIVGRWNKIIELAHKIYSQFREWVNNSLTLSAGVAIVRPKFPILKAALMAGEEEELAKSHQFSNTSKNSISFLSFPLSFDTEYDLVRRLKEHLSDHIRKKNISSSTIYKLYSFKMMKDKHEDTIQKHQWKWLMAYDFSRNKKNENKDFLDKILNDAIQNQNSGSSYHYLDLLCLAARWAEFENR